MSVANDNQEQNDENMTLDIEEMSEGEKEIFKRREFVFKNMCDTSEQHLKTKELAEKFNVDERTIYRDKDWCKRDRPSLWANALAKHGFLYNTMEYETRMKRDLAWLYQQRDETPDPMERLAFQKEISATLNNIIAVGSKHPFYEGIKKIIEENEAKAK